MKIERKRERRGVKNKEVIDRDWNIYRKKLGIKNIKKCILFLWYDN